MCVHVYCFCALVCIQSNTSAADNFKTEWPVWRLYSACPIFQVFLMACSTTEMVKLNWAVKILCVQVAWIWLIAWNTINAHSCSTPSTGIFCGDAWSTLWLNELQLLFWMLSGSLWNPLMQARWQLYIDTVSPGIQMLHSAQAHLCKCWLVVQ